jgi:hypothetical protein
MLNDKALINLLKTSLVTLKISQDNDTLIKLLAYNKGVQQAIDTVEAFYSGKISNDVLEQLNKEG